MVAYGLTRRDIDIARLQVYFGMPYGVVMQELKALYAERKKKSS